MINCSTFLFSFNKLLDWPQHDRNLKKYFVSSFGSHYIVEFVLNIV
jgi:hypothetical protein